MTIHIYVWMYGLFKTLSSIVACSYAVSNSGPVHTYEQREQATITALIQNISLGKARLELETP